MNPHAIGFGIFYLSHHTWAMAEAFDRGIVGNGGSVLQRESAASLPTSDDVFRHGAFGFATKRFDFRPEDACLGSSDVWAIFGPENDHFDLRDMWITVALDAWEGAVPPLVDLRWPSARQREVVAAGFSWACEPRASEELASPVGMNVPLGSGKAPF